MCSHYVAIEILGYWNFIATRMKHVWKSGIYKMHFLSVSCFIGRVKQKNKHRKLLTYNAYWFCLGAKITNLAVWTGLTPDLYRNVY